MKIYPLIIAICLTAVCGWAQKSASPVVKTSYDIETGGALCRYELALDEVSVKEASGKRTVRKTAAADVASTLRELHGERAKGAGEVALVLYEKDKPRSDLTRAHVTNQIVVRLENTALANGVATAAGLRVARVPAHAPGLAILEADSPEDALAAMESLRAAAGVQSADVMLARQKQKKTALNDTYYANQWHLRNTTQQGGALWIDLNVEPVWANSITGTGVTVGIVDDGLQHAHPDLQPNYNAALSYDFNGNDSDPAPVDLVNDGHGTSAAGLVGARGNNGVGVSGVAYQAGLAGLRLIAAPTTDQEEADAFNLHNNLIHVKSNSWGEPDTGSNLGGAGPLAKAALINGVTTGRGGRGTIYVFAGGNGLDVQDNSNYDSFANAIQVIAVGAVNDFGFQSYYSEPGANLVVCAPANGGDHNEGIATTDLTGEAGYNHSGEGANDLSNRSYTRTFGGTSAACPETAGVVALMLQANPNLGWRDVKEILLRSARPVHATDPDWLTNAAGMHFNHKYGAGLADAAAAVTLAQTWTNLPTATSTQLANAIAAAIPDNSTNGVTRTFNFANANFRVEHVEVTANIAHAYRGDLEVILTSPSGMTSRLAEQRDDPGDNYSNWTFSSVRHWGESAAGSWTVKVADRSQGVAGTVTSVTVKLHGTTNAGARIAGTTTTLTSETNLPANTAVDPGETVTFSLGLRNIGATNASSLVATLLPIGGVNNPSVAQNYGTLAAAGATVTRAFTFATGGASGTKVKAILLLQDGATPLGYASVVIPLGKSTTTQSTVGGSIVVRDNTTGTPSPSTVTVSGITGRVQNMTVLVGAFTHAFPDDVGLLLQGPDALQMRIFAGGASTPISNASYTFDGNAAIYMPLGGTVPTGSYKPFDKYPSSRPMTLDPNDEPAYTLGEFNGVPANGTWRLFAEDFDAGSSGSIGNWRLTFTTVDCTDNVFFAQAASSVAENASSVPVTVIRTGGREGTATVNYTTGNAGATAGSDYTATSGTLTFLAGELQKTITIPIINDSTPETDEVLNVTLSSPTGKTQLGSLAAATVTIVSDDLTPVNLSPASPLVLEGNTQVTFTVSRASIGTTGTVTYTTTAGSASAGADYTTTSGTLIFAANDLSKAFNVSILNDGSYETDETFSATISTPTGGLSLGATSTATTTIRDGDTDSDTLPDDYETSNGLNPNLASDAQGNPDGDSFTNAQEFILGTDPQNRASTLVLDVSFSGNNSLVTFATVVGRTYTIERSDNLLPPWTVVQSGIAGTGGPVIATDTNGATQPRRFYHAIVQP